MNIQDLIFENLVSVFLVKIPILKFFDADPEPGSCQPWIRDPGWKKSHPGSWIRDEHPGPATLLLLMNFIFHGSNPPPEQDSDLHSFTRKAEQPTLLYIFYYHWNKQQVLYLNISNCKFSGNSMKNTIIRQLNR
jgi:hypothetical protein